MKSALIRLKRNDLYLMEPLQNIQLTFKCPKTLNDLSPCNSDWYCAGCNRIIMDFRGMEESRILDSLNNGDKIHCGIFDAQRIAYTPQSKWYRWLSAALIALGLNTLNNRVFAQQKVATSGSDTTAAKQKATADSSVNQVTLGIFLVSAQPEYPGGITRFYDRLQSNLHKVSVKEAVTTVVKFTIERDGTPVNARLVTSGNAKVDKQLVQLIKTSYRWKPGVINGRPVVTDYNCTVKVNPNGKFDINVEQVSQTGSR
ncbi:energy transducer TonB [Mucilaginibacter kameinonensis]|uniref:energy transducer TonB n=1 Tax=Mucilaginibacter kameinonensis TaxID=452286 RepID=UPI000EF7F8DE|nr:energy transducer TonB [Mucilaginibacter kameinonensis]